MNKKRLVAGTVAAFLLIGGGTVAFAYWTTGGTGTGTAATAAGAANQLSVAGDAASAMFPGDSPQTVTATVANNGTENYQVNTLTVSVTTSNAGCTGADYLVNGSPAVGAVDLGIVPADLAPTGTTTRDFTMQFNNTASDQNVCKGAVVTLTYAAS